MINKNEVIEIEDDDAPEAPSEFKLVKKNKRRIIFCIDVDNAMGDNLRASANGGIKDTNLYYSPRMETVLRFIKRYIQMNKLIGNLDDLYSIILLKDTAQWWADFTSETPDDEVENALEQITLENGDYDTMDISSIFKEIKREVDVEDSNCFIQAIVIYARDIVPFRPYREQYSDIRASKNFTLDVIYLHTGKENIQTIYDIWNELDSPVNRGWYYEAGSFNGKDIAAKAFSQLLAHPLQRGEQERIEDFIK